MLVYGTSLAAVNIALTEDEAEMLDAILYVALKDIDRGKEYDFVESLRNKVVERRVGYGHTI